jgi:hypothetical protein
MNMDHWLNYDLQGKVAVIGEESLPVPLCLACPRFFVDYPGVESGPRR